MMFLADTTDPIQQLFDKVQLNQVSFFEMVTSMSMAFAVGFLIFFIYRICFKGTVYNYLFNISLLILTMITAMVILTISSNIILSLGMVGALSIVRFRSALKDPVDIVYIFWAIAAGLAIGAAQYLLALVGTTFISTALIILTRVRYSIKTYVLTVTYATINDDVVMSCLTHFKANLKSKYIENQHIELTLELTKQHEQIVKSLNELDVIKTLSILAFEE